MRKIYRRKPASATVHTGQSDGDGGDVSYPLFTLSYSSLPHCLEQRRFLDSRRLADPRHYSNKAITAIANHLNAGNQTASIQTTCHAGTHRSVAAAEIIANEMRRRGVSVVVRHAHRRRGVGDAR